MAVLPVIERELRAQSRSRFTYLIRVIAASAVLVVCIQFAIEWGLKPAFGRQLFAQLHAAVFGSIWLLVPLFTADCISFERREGTLGLLFLTPLSASGIVLAKGLVHGLRAVTLWLSVLPIMTIAFLVGGVSWSQMVVSIMINFTAICLALGAGVLASSFAKRWGHALFLAMGFALIFFGVQCFATGLARMLADGLQFAPQATGYVPSDFNSNRLQHIFDLGFGIVTGLQTMLRGIFIISSRSPTHGLLALGLAVVFGAGLLLAVIQLAAWNMQRVWHEEPPSARQVWLEKKLMTPVIGVNFLHAWLRRKLERNPVGWLEQRSWSGRIVTWGWFSVMISFYSVAFRGDNIQRIITTVQHLMPIGMLMVMAGVACGSFQRERETRVLELLLISPMKAYDIITGRLRGLWGQFLPCLILMLFVQASFHFVLKDEMDMGILVYFCSSYLAVPLVGLFYSLKSSNFITAFLSVLIVGLVLPVAIPPVEAAGSYLLLHTFGFVGPGSGSDAGLLVQIIVRQLDSFFSWDYSPTVIQGLITYYLGLKLHRNLMNRNFAFVRAAT